MTYCVAIKLKAGVIFASDSRTSAGVDNISVFCKTHQFQVPGDREIFLLNSGNLATTQEVISILRREVQKGEEGHILSLDSLFDVARRVGDTIRNVIGRLSSPRSGVDFSCSFLVGGQIRGEHQRLFMIYPEGNFIEATQETPFFQIGELKYGKPILDRVINYQTPINDAVKCILVSFDSTMRSNLSVGLPINVAYLPTVSPEVIGVAKPFTSRIDENNESFKKLRHEWCEGLQQVFSNIPNLDWWNNTLHEFEDDPRCL